MRKGGIKGKKGMARGWEGEALNCDGAPLRMRRKSKGSARQKLFETTVQLFI